MPSRKKAKGKARKAAKQAEAKEAEAANSKEEESQAMVANQRQRGELDAHIQWLMIKNAKPMNCKHGCLLSDGDQKICKDFINAFIVAFISSQVDLWHAFGAATKATEDEYADMYSDSKLDTVISMLLCNGTQRVLEGDNYTAQLYAILTCQFEGFMAVEVHKNKATDTGTKVYELHEADDHTLVQYYRKRIPCTCLDEKYKEVKSVKKMGFCCNPSCTHPGRKVERSMMFCCTRCGEANYCSVECQRADWKRHRKDCGSIVEKKAAFKSNQT